MKPHFTSGAWIANFGFDFESGNEAIEKGTADLVSFGSLYVANDNLVEKFEKGITPNKMSNVEDPKLIQEYIYGEGPLGYTDLSVWEAKE